MTAVEKPLEVHHPHLTATSTNPSRNTATHTICVLARVKNIKEKEVVNKVDNAGDDEGDEVQYDIPVTRNTRIVSLVREVAELVLPAVFLQRSSDSKTNNKIPNNSLPPVVFGALFYEEKELEPEKPVSELPKDAILHFYFGEALRKRGGKGCELRPYDPTVSSPQRQLQPPSPSSFYRPKYASSAYSGVSGTSSKGNGISEDGEYPWMTEDGSYSPYGGLSFADKPSGGSYQSGPSYPAENIEAIGSREGISNVTSPTNGGLRSMAVNTAPINYASSSVSKPSTAPAGNPWGLEERGPTYRIPIRSTADAPFYPNTTSAPVTPNPTPTPSSYQPRTMTTHQTHSQQIYSVPNSPQSQYGSAFPPPSPPVSLRDSYRQPQSPIPATPTSYSQTQQDTSGIHPGTMMMMGPNGPMPIMMMMPFFATNQAGFSPQMQQTTVEKQQLQSGILSPRGRGATVTPHHTIQTTHAARPPSVAASESRLTSRSQRFFGESQAGSEVLTLMSEPQDCSPIPIDNTAKKNTYREFQEESPVPSRPIPKRLDFDNLDDSQEVMITKSDVPQNQKNRDINAEKPVLLTVERVISRREDCATQTTTSVGVNTPASQIIQVDNVVEEDVQAKRSIHPETESNIFEEDVQKKSNIFEEDVQKKNNNFIPMKDETVEEDAEQEVQLKKKKPLKKKKEKRSNVEDKEPPVGSKEVEVKEEPPVASFVTNTIVNVVSNIEPSDEYMYLNVELPKDVDPQLVCGLGDNSANSFTVGGENLPESVVDSVAATACMAADGNRASADGAAPLHECIRRLRVHRQTPVGTLRELLNVKPKYAIVIKGQVIRDELQTLEELGVPNEALISFAELEKKGPKRRPMVLPQAFLDAMKKPEPEPHETERETTITTVRTPVDTSRVQKLKKKRPISLKNSARKEFPNNSKEAEKRSPKPPSKVFSAVEKQESNPSLIQVVSPPSLSLENGIDSANVTPRENKTTVNLADGHDSHIGHVTSDASARQTPHKNRSTTKPPDQSLNNSQIKNRNETNRNSRSGSALVITPGVLNPEKEERIKNSRPPSSKPHLEPLIQHKPRTIDVNDLSSASHPLEDEEDVKRILASAQPPPSSSRSAGSPREATTVSKQMVIRRQRVKRTTNHALTVGTAVDDSIQHSEIDDSIAEGSNGKTLLTVKKRPVAPPPRDDAKSPSPLALYTFKRRYSENNCPSDGPDTMYITIRDPVNPDELHKDVPVDKNCPVSILKAWLLRDDSFEKLGDNLSSSLSEEVAGRTVICYRGERVPVENEQMTFKTVTELFPNGVFSFLIDQSK